MFDCDSSIIPAEKVFEVSASSIHSSKYRFNHLHNQLLLSTDHSVSVIQLDFGSSKSSLKHIDFFHNESITSLILHDVCSVIVDYHRIHYSLLQKVINSFHIIPLISLLYRQH